MQSKYIYLETVFVSLVETSVLEWNKLHSFKNNLFWLAFVPGDTCHYNHHSARISKELANDRKMDKHWRSLQD